MQYLNYIILLLGLIELITVRFIGYPFELSNSAMSLLHFSKDISTWLGVLFAVAAIIIFLLQMKKEERNIPFTFNFLVSTIIIAAVVHQIYSTLFIPEIILYVSAFLTILLVFNLRRREMERQSHLICYLFAAPLLFRFLNFSLETFQRAGFFTIPFEIFGYLQNVDEILMLVALLGVGIVVFDKISFGWNFRRSLVVFFNLIFMIFFTVSLIVWPWSTLAIIQEFGWNIFSKSPIWAIVFYGFPMLFGFSTILLLCVERKTFSLGCGLLFILLGQSSMSHVSLFYQLLALLGFFYVLDEGAKKPRYILGKRSPLFAS